MHGNGLKARHGWNGWKWLKMTDNFWNEWKWLKIFVGNCQNDGNCLEMAKNCINKGANCCNDSKWLHWLEIAENYWKLL